MSLGSPPSFLSSPDGAPALKRLRTLITREDDLGVEEMEGDRSSDNEEEALPLTFHTKEDLIRKLQGINQLPRGKPC